MKLIIPMAGIGKRLRPHTLTTPKPLLPVAGESIVKRLVYEIVRISKTKIDEVAYIVGDFGEEVEAQLLKIAEELDATGRIYYQEEALGTAHAVFCAEPSLIGKVIVAFADTLFYADFDLEEDADAVIWTKTVENPESFGVIKKDVNGYITDFIEKPKEFISNEAIIGIYYFKSGENLKEELHYLIENNIKGNNEFQLTDALENMKNKGLKFKSATVNEWLDCGNKEAILNTNKSVLRNEGNHISGKSIINNSVILEPCYISKGAKISDSIIGPFVSIGKNTVIKNSIIKNSILQKESELENTILYDSMIGNFAKIFKNHQILDIGDYNVIK
jgi:glucose-1-phosphate thymidylyltransferase